MYLTLWLEGFLQAYGAGDACYYRPSEDFPTKGAVLGIILSAMGKKGPQTELLLQLSQCSHTVYRYLHSRKQKSPYELMLDFQTVGQHVDKNDIFADLKRLRSAVGNTLNSGKILQKQYIQNAAFGAVIEVPDDLGDDIANALRNPARALSLGRACCIPNMKIFWGINPDKSTAEDALHIPQQISSERMISAPWVLDAIRSDDALEDSEISFIKDVPKSFGDFDTRRHVYRKVYTKYLD